MAGWPGPAHDRPTPPTSDTITGGPIRREPPDRPGGLERSAIVKITQIETIRVAERPLNIWVQVHTDEGIVGLGETFYAPSVVEAAVHDWFGPAADRPRPVCR